MAIGLSITKEIEKKYNTCKFKSTTGKQKKLLFEEINITLYKPSAHCVGFYTTEERIQYWAKALQDHHFHRSVKTTTTMWHESTATTMMSKLLNISSLK